MCGKQGVTSQRKGGKERRRRQKMNGEGGIGASLALEETLDSGVDIAKGCLKGANVFGVVKESHFVKLLELGREALLRRALVLLLSLLSTGAGESTGPLESTEEPLSALAFTSKGGHQAGIGELLHGLVHLRERLDRVGIGCGSQHLRVAHSLSNLRVLLRHLPELWIGVHHPLHHARIRQHRLDEFPHPRLLHHLVELLERLPYSLAAWHPWKRSKPLPLLLASFIASRPRVREGARIGRGGRGVLLALRLASDPVACSMAPSATGGIVHGGLLEGFVHAAQHVVTLGVRFEV